MARTCLHRSSMHAAVGTSVRGRSQRRAPPIHAGQEIDRHRDRRADRRGARRHLQREHHRGLHAATLATGSVAAVHGGELGASIAERIEPLGSMHAGCELAVRPPSLRRTRMHSAVCRRRPGCRRIGRRRRRGHGMWCRTAVEQQREDEQAAECVSDHRRRRLRHRARSFNTDARPDWHGTKEEGPLARAFEVLASPRGFEPRSLP
jgi:hypothetical protein